MICVCYDHPDVRDVIETCLGIVILDTGIPVYYSAGDATKGAMMTSGFIMLLGVEKQCIVYFLMTSQQKILMLSIII